MVLLVVLVVAGLLFLAAVVATQDGDVLADAPPDDLPLALPAGRMEAEDLRSVRFSMALRGYRMDQVDEVLDRLGAEIAERDARLADLERVLAEIVEPVVEEVESRHAVRVEVEAEPQPSPPEPAPSTGLAASLALGVPAAEVPLPEAVPEEPLAGGAPEELPAPRVEPPSPAAAFRLPLPEPHGDPLVPQHSEVPRDEAPAPLPEEEVVPHGDALLHPGPPVEHEAATEPVAVDEPVTSAPTPEEPAPADALAWWDEQLVPATEEPSPHGDPLVPHTPVDDGLDFPDVQRAEPADPGTPEAVDADEGDRPPPG